MFLIAIPNSSIWIPSALLSINKLTSSLRTTIGLSQRSNFSRCKFQRDSTVHLLGYSTCRHPWNVCDELDSRKLAKHKWRRGSGSGRVNLFYVWTPATPLSLASWETHINAKERRDRICLTYLTPIASLLINCFHFFKIKVYGPVLCLLLISFLVIA